MNRRYKARTRRIYRYECGEAQGDFHSHDSRYEVVRHKTYEAVLPPQSGILRPDLILRAASMRPHLSSHSLPGVLY